MVDVDVVVEVLVMWMWRLMCWWGGWGMEWGWGMFWEFCDNMDYKSCQLVCQQLTRVIGSQLHAIMTVPTRMREFFARTTNEARDNMFAEEPLNWVNPRFPLRRNSSTEVRIDRPLSCSLYARRH